MASAHETRAVVYLRIAENIRRRITTGELPAGSMLPSESALARDLGVARGTQQAAGPAWHNLGLVFTTRYGTPVEPRNFHRSFKARCDRAGVPSVSVHTTRRTCASMLVALDVHPRVAMQILRHSQIAVTMNVYSEVSSKETREALKRLGSQLGA